MSSGSRWEPSSNGFTRSCCRLEALRPCARRPLIRQSTFDGYVPLKPNTVIPKAEEPQSGCFAPTPCRVLCIGEHRTSKQREKINQSANRSERHVYIRHPFPKVIARKGCVNREKRVWCV